MVSNPLEVAPRFHEESSENVKQSLILVIFSMPMVFSNAYLREPWQEPIHKLKSWLKQKKRKSVSSTQMVSNQIMVLFKLGQCFINQNSFVLPSHHGLFCEERLHLMPTDKLRPKKRNQDACDPVCAMDLTKLTYLSCERINDLFHGQCR